jgi:hypothetical protein
MPRAGRLPFFLGRETKSWSGAEILLEADDCTVMRWRDWVHLTFDGPWTKRHAKLAERYKVNSLGLHNLAFGSRRTVEFLPDLPSLRRLSISLWKPIDLSALGQLRQLRSLRLSIDLWRSGDLFRPVDLSGLDKLQFADVMMCRAFESVLKCSTLTELWVSNDYDGRLRDLDLTHLPVLRHLKLDHCPKLRNVGLHPKARLRGLALTLCGSYKIDWHRLGPDLRYLLLGGRLTFPLEDILNAPKLEGLHMVQIRKLPALRFLRKLRDLRMVDIFTAPPGPNLSEEDKALIREINARGRRKPRNPAHVVCSTHENSATASGRPRLPPALRALVGEAFTRRSQREHRRIASRKSLAQAGSRLAGRRSSTAIGDRPSNASIMARILCVKRASCALGAWLPHAS